MDWGGPWQQFWTEADKLFLHFLAHFCLTVWNVATQAAHLESQFPLYSQSCLLPSPFNAADEGSDDTLLSLLSDAQQLRGAKLNDAMRLHSPRPLRANYYSAFAACLPPPHHHSHLIALPIGSSSLLWLCRASSAPPCEGPGSGSHLQRE